MPTLDETVRQILALPREAGTPEALKARELVADYLTGLGYTVVSQGFTFAPSSLRRLSHLWRRPGRPGSGTVPFPRLRRHSGRGQPSAVWSSGLLALTIVAGGVGLGWVHLGEGVREDANLIATCGSSPPRRWVVAHLDSKAQGHSMAGRLMAVWVVGWPQSSLTALVLFRFTGALLPLVAGRGHRRGLAGGIPGRPGPTQRPLARRPRQRNRHRGRPCCRGSTGIPQLES